MTKRESYQVVIDDALAKINILQSECVDLKNELEKKKAKIVEVENTVAILKNDLFPEVDLPKEDELSTKKEIDEEKTGRNSAMEQKLAILRDDQQRRSYSPKKESSISLSDATEIILEALGLSMHADELLGQLNLIGRFPDKATYVSTIRKDHKNRFVNLGQNIWDLRNRQENLIDTKMTNEQ